MNLGKLATVARPKVELLKFGSIPPNRWRLKILMNWVTNSLETLSVTRVLLISEKSSLMTVKFRRSWM
jgi:hypothetical protein